MVKDGTDSNTPTNANNVPNDVIDIITFDKDFKRFIGKVSIDIERFIIMYAFKEIRKATNDTITIKIPDRLKNKNIEIILLPTDEKISSDEESNNIENDLFFDTVKIDTKHWKFNRKEIYE